MNPQIISSKDKIKDLITRYKPSDDDLLKRDMARYACVLVSGHLEESLRLLVSDYVKGKSTLIVHRYVESNINRITNCTYNKIVNILKSFSQPWADEFCNNIVTYEPIPNKYKDSVDSIVAVRHQIAHGKNTGISMVMIEGYFNDINQVIEILNISIK